MIFVKSVVGKGNILKVFPLSGQKLPTGEPIDCKWPVKFAGDIVNRYAMGSKFCLEKLSKQINYYRAETRLFVLNTQAASSDRPEDSVFEEYNALIGSMDDEEAISLKQEDKPVVKPRRYIDRLRSNVKYVLPTIENDGFYVDEDTWYLALRNIKQQINTLFLGPSGLGKTSLVNLIAKKCGLNYAEYDMGSMLDPHAGLLGVHRLGKDGSVFDYAKFTDDITKKGVVLLDELSRAPLSANNILFPTLDFRRKLPVEIAAGKDCREFKLHEECSMVATANEGVGYSGTLLLDKALKSRFFLVELDYLPAEIETKLLSIRSEIPNSEASKIVGVANNVRKMYKRGDISDAPGTRETLMAADMIRDGYSDVQALEYTFLPLFEGTKSEGERSTVALAIGSK